MEISRPWLHGDSVVYIALPVDTYVLDLAGGQE